MYRYAPREQTNMSGFAKNRQFLDNTHDRRLRVIKCVYCSARDRTDEATE